MSITLATLAHRFLLDPTLAPATKKSYEGTLLPIVEKLGCKLLGEVKRGDVVGYLESLTHLSWRTHNRHQKIITRLFNYAIESGHIEQNPCLKIKRRKPNKEKGELGSDERFRFLEQEALALLFKQVRPNKRLSALVWLLYESGARINEVLSLRREAVQFERREFVVSGKGNKERVCYFGQKTEAALTSYINGYREHPHEMLFTQRGVFDRRVKPLTYQNAHKDLVAAIDGIPLLTHMRFHDLRHTFATERAKIIPIELLRALLGHESIQTTLIYQHITSRVAKEAAKEAFEVLYKLHP